MSVNILECLLYLALLRNLDYCWLSLLKLFSQDYRMLGCIFSPFTERMNVTKYSERNSRDCGASLQPGLGLQLKCNLTPPVVIACCIPGQEKSQCPGARLCSMPPLTILLKHTQAATTSHQGRKSEHLPEP